MPLDQWLGKNKTNARRVVSDHFNNTCVMNVNFEDELLSALIQHHPSKAVPKHAVFRKCIREPFKTQALYIVGRDGSLFECSWLKCIDNYFGKYNIKTHTKLNKLSALRNAIFYSPVMQSARQLCSERGAVCAKCTKDKKLTVDHVGIPFSKLVDDFLALKDMKLASLPIVFRDGAYAVSNDELRAEWVAFHDELVEYEGLCSSCNASKGSGGYRHRKETAATPA